MSTCAKISANIVIDCDNPLTGGAYDRLILINKDDWDEATIGRNVSNDQLIESIVLATGDIGYSFEGKNNSIEPRSALVKQRYAEVYDHEVTFKIFSVDATAKEQLDLMARGKVVAIIENNFRGPSGAAAFEVFGDEVGLELAELERVTADDETQGAFNVVLRTSEQSKEAHLPAALFVTGYAETKVIVDGLVA